MNRKDGRTGQENRTDRVVRESFGLGDEQLLEEFGRAQEEIEDGKAGTDSEEEFQTLMREAKLRRREAETGRLRRQTGMLKAALVTVTLLTSVLTSLAAGSFL